MLVMLGFGCLFATIYLGGDGGEVCRDKYVSSQVVVLRSRSDHGVVCCVF